MAWDSGRPVPWKRLMVEWAIVVVGIALVSTVWGDSPAGEVAVAAVFGGVIYLVFGAFMAKLGYSRTTLRELRAQAEQRAASSGTGPRGSTARSSATTVRSRPGPTSRTSTGPSQHPRKKKR